MWINIIENKEKLRKEARERYQNLSEEEEEEEKKRQYYCEHNKHFSEEEKEKKFHYIKNYYLAHKKNLLSWLMDF